MSAEIKTKDWCPACLLQHKTLNVLMNRPGQFYSNCAAGHQFPDTEELNTLRNQARSKYPEHYKSNTPTPVDPAVLAGMDITINAEVKKSIEEIVGQPITSGGDLKGLLYAYFNDNKDKESEIRSLRATMAQMGRRNSAAVTGASPHLQPGQFVITVPEWAVEGVQSMASHSDKTPDEWIAEEIGGYFENYFGTAAAAQR